MSWLLCLFDSVGLDYDASYKAQSKCLCGGGDAMHARGAQTPRGSVQVGAEGVCNARTGWGDAKLNCSGVILEPSYKPGIRRFVWTTWREAM